MTSWDTPHREKPEKPNWHPAVLAWLAVDLLYIAANYVRNKHRSLTTERWAVTLELNNALQNALSVAIDESVPLQARKDAAKSARSTLNAVDEYNINNENIEMHRERYNDLPEDLKR